MTRTIDLSEGWELGWYPEPTLSRWLQIYPTWRVRDGRLMGRKELYPAQIVVNTHRKQDLVWRFNLRLEDEGARVRLMAQYSVPRVTYYSIAFAAGAPLAVGYHMLAEDEATLLEQAGPTIEAGVDYAVECRVEKGLIRIQLDGEPACEFAADRFSGDLYGFSVDSGLASFGDVSLTDALTDEVLFADDFSRDSLRRTAPVALGELQCERWIPAPVPGTVHTALLAAGVIEDPYVGAHGREVTWVDDQRWVYRTTFNVPADWTEEQLALVFDGLDYHGYVWLNGNLLGYHEGMLNRFARDVSSIVRREGANELVVCLLPCPTPPHSNVKPYSLNHWHINMDIVTVGIWRPVRLIASDKVSVHDPRVIVRGIEDNSAEVEISAQVTASFSWPFDIIFRLVITPPAGEITSPEGEIKSPAGEITSPEDGETEPIVQEWKLGYCPGTHTVARTVRIDNPRLWWPNGMGGQPLYHLAIEVEVSSVWSRELSGSDRLEFDFGVRTLEMRQTPDGLARYPWIFCINGRPFFGKGANWTPIDQMLRLSPERYALMLGRAREAGINMLRPWGGGPLETDEFYRECDRLGICVMQDFPLANGVFHEIDRTVWREMIRENVTRLRNHPSLVLWSGGNEFEPDCPQNKDLIDDLEHGCRQYDPTRDFHRASPFGGDNHSYGVYWLEGLNYTHYSRDMSHAITEFALASVPAMESLKRVIPAAEFEEWPFATLENLEPFDWKGYRYATHGRESGFSLHDAHLERLLKRGLPLYSDVGVPESWEEFIAFTQTAQGIATQFGIDHWRSRWPYCTATFPWVFNSPWPLSLFWEFVDYFGVPKASFYYLKRVYEQLHVGAVFEELFWRPGSRFTAKIFACNDTLERQPDVRVTVKLYGAALEPLATRNFSCNLEADAVKHCGYFEFAIPADMPDQVLFMATSLYDQAGRLLSRGINTPRVGVPIDKMPYLKNGPWVSDVKARTTELELSCAGPWEPGGDGRCACTIQVRNAGERPAYQVHLLMSGARDGIESRTSYSDNYFWLEAGEAREIVIQTPAADAADAEVIARAWNAAGEQSIAPAAAAAQLSQV